MEAVLRKICSLHGKYGKTKIKKLKSKWRITLKYATYAKKSYLCRKQHELGTRKKMLALFCELPMGRSKARYQSYSYFVKKKFFTKQINSSQMGLKTLL